MELFKQITESQFTNKFAQMNAEQLAEFVMLYSMILSAEAQDENLKSGAQKNARSILGPGNFDTFRSSMDDYYNAVAALTDKKVADRFNLDGKYPGLASAVKNFLQDIAQGVYTTSRSERHLYALQKACKLTGNSTISNIRMQSQSWAAMTDLEKKVHTERLKNLMSNLYSGSSGVSLSKKLGSEYTTTAKEKASILPTVVATVGGFVAGRALGKWAAK